MPRTSITRRTRTYLHPLRIAPPGMRPTGLELPWLEEIGTHRPSSHGLTMTLALLVIALLLPMRNVHAVKAVDLHMDAPDEALEEPEPGVSWAELFGLPGIYHAGCVQSLLPESPGQFNLRIFNGPGAPGLATGGGRCGVDARAGFPPSG